MNAALAGSAENPTVEEQRLLIEKQERARTAAGILEGKPTYFCEGAAGPWLPVRSFAQQVTLEDGCVVEVPSVGVGSDEMACPARP